MEYTLLNIKDVQQTVSIFVKDSSILKKKKKKTLQSV